MERHDAGFCCPKAYSQQPSQSAMDLDLALNELGMLSTVTDSRKEFIREQERSQHRKVLGPRSRNLSEPSFIGAGTPSNSPTKGGYQIVELNPQFVTSLSPGLAATYSIPSTSSAGLSPESSNHIHIDFGERYRREELEQDAKANRLSRLKISRVKRFRKPYELPWRKTLERTYTCQPSEIEEITPLQYSMVTPFFEETPEKNCPIDKSCSSNASTPEKSRLHPKSASSVVRSRSLDDLDLSKLQLSTVNNPNFVQEHREIDSVSQHLQNLHVAE